MNINTFFEMISQFWNTSFIDFGHHGMLSVRLAALLYFLAIVSAIAALVFFEENSWFDLVAAVAILIVIWFVVFGVFLARSSASGSIYSAQTTQQKTVVEDPEVVTPPQ
ncbi:MAG: hypothetical protein ABL901_03230 [Hyphomicrobiaceae bacterium]